MNASLCASCGFQNRVGAIFCSSCGDSLASTWQCPNCGATLSREYKFCGVCGSPVGASRAAARAVERSAGSTDNPRPYIQSPSTPTRLHSVTALLKRRLTPISTVLLWSGALLVILAQVYLTFAYEPGRDAPDLGVAALIAGLVLFALGAFGMSPNSDIADVLSRVNVAVPKAVTDNLTLVRISIAAFGFVMLGLLVLRLAAGSESGWDLLLWLAAVCALAAPFMRRSALSLPRMVPPREYYPDILIVLALVVIFVALNAHDLTDWYYSAIGDEYAFWNLAGEILNNGIARPFSQEGVYNHHPYLNSVYQAAVMWIFTEHHFWWKFSSVLSGALAIPGVYILGHTLGGRKAAIASAVLFSFSHYIFAQAHIGNNNLDSVPIAVWSITLFVLGIRKSSASLLYAAGIMAGLGFYTHYSARSVAPIIFLFGLTAFRPREIFSLWPLVLGFALAFAPTFLVEREHLFTRMFSQASGGYSESVSGQFGERILGNVKNNLLAFNYNPDAHTWVSGALLDPLSAVLAILGVSFALGSLCLPSQRLLLIWFVVAIIATGVLSPFPIVAITRLYFVVPSLALLGGMLVACILDRVLASNKSVESARINSRVWTAAALTTLATLVLALSAWQFWYATPKIFRHTKEAVAIGAMRSDACDGELEGVIMIGRSTTPLLKPALESYHPDGVMPYLLDHSDANAGESLPEEPPRCVIFLNPEDEEVQAFKQDFAIRYPEGRFSTFSSPSGATSVEIFVPDAA